jgi:hypothetical protein
MTGPSREVPRNGFRSGAPDQSPTISKLLVFLTRRAQEENESTTAIRLPEKDLSPGRNWCKKKAVLDG